MHGVIHPRRGARLAFTALALAFEMATIAAPRVMAQAQTSPTTSTSTGGAACGGAMGPADYPIPGGWFYTEEACAWKPIIGRGPSRQRGYSVVDDDRGNFWTEFRRYGGVDVLGYPISTPYHYPPTNPGGAWYQGFERGILQMPDNGQGRGDLANAFEQFTEAGLDDQLEFLGIAQPNPAQPDLSFQRDAERRMGWLTEPRFLARFFFDPVASHSSDPDLIGQTSFTNQEQAWDFFGLPQGSSERLMLRAAPGGDVLKPLMHSFIGQRFQKAGLELFVEDVPATQEQFLPSSGDALPVLFDPTIVPGDGKNGCVALTAVGLIGRRIGLNRTIPLGAVQPEPADPSPDAFFTTHVPPNPLNSLKLDFQLDGTGFDAGEPVTIKLTDGVAAGGTTSTAQPPLPTVTSHVDAALNDGSFEQVVTARIGTYTVTASGDKSGRTYSTVVDLTKPTQDMARTTTCTNVGLPIGQ